MAIILRNGLRFSRINKFAKESNPRESSCSIGPFSKPVVLKNEFNLGTKRMDLKLRTLPSTIWQLKCYSEDSNHVENPVETSQNIAWWERAHGNYRDVLSAEDLYNSLKNAGNKLVVVEFYSPSCGGCRTLNPKMYQISEKHQEAVFMKVNWEVHKFFCDDLVVPVLPFFHFYRGAQGCICRFSCTIGTIHKMKGALKKHGNGQGGPDPAEGLEEASFLSKLQAGRLNLTGSFEFLAIVKILLCMLLSISSILFMTCSICQLLLG